MTELSAFIDRLVKEQFDDVQGRLADAIGMSESGFSRAVKNEGTLSAENCLRLAKVAGEHPSRVLRMAGKGDVAELIEQLYGEAHPAMSQVDRDLVALDDDTKRDVLRFVTRLFGKKISQQRTAKPPATTRRRESA